MSILSPLSASTIYNAVNTSQKQINDILKSLETGLSVNSTSDDPAILAISDSLNLQALDAASTSNNAQDGLSYLQTMQGAYDNILSELDKIEEIANTALNGTYTESQLSSFQDSIVESIGKIKYIEQSTLFKGVQVFDNNNSAGLVNEHMFALTSKVTTTVTTVTTTQVGSGDYDYKSYLAQNVNRYTEQSGGILTNGVDPNLTIGANVITIKSAAELISALDNQATAGKTYVLMDNIDLSGLGTKTTSLLRGTFDGTFIGNGYAVKGLDITSTDSNLGLFELIGSSGKVQDLVIKDFNINGSQVVGSLAGMSFGDVSNVASLNATIMGDAKVGGLIGHNEGNISYSYTTGDIIGNSGSSTLGGLVGENSMSDIQYSFSTANVSGSSYVGGLVGSLASSNLKESYATGNVAGEQMVGGLVGYNNSSTISDTYAYGDVSAKYAGGGLVGSMLFGSVINSYSASKVTDTEITYEALSQGTSVSSIASDNYDDYNVLRTVGGKTYAFASSADATNFNDGVTINGDISKYYLKDGDVWTAKSASTTSHVTQADAIAQGYNMSHIIRDASEFVSKIQGHENENFIVVGNLDFSSLGVLNNSAITNAFTGKLDGNGYTIKNLQISTAAAGNNIGLFSSFGAGATVNDLSIEATISAANKSYVGILVGTTGSSVTIDNVHVSGSVSGVDYVGGLVGNSSSTISNSSADVTVNATGRDVGGFAGSAGASITNSYSSGTVSGDSSVGGFVGNSIVGTITNSYSTANVNASDIAGGFIGYNFGGTVTNSSASGDVIGTNSDIGGFVGSNVGTIKQSSAYGNITANYNVGGFAGNNLSTIQDSFSKGDTTGSSSVGGFIGNTSGGSVTNSYTTSIVSASSSKGGFVGSQGTATTITDSFYKNNMSTDVTAAVNASVAPMPTSSWNTSIWNTSNELPTIKDSYMNLSRPQDVNYDYSYTASGGVMPSGLYYFSTLESKNNFININNGTSDSYSDIYAYQYNSGTENWDMIKISKTTDVGWLIGASTVSTVTNSFYAPGINNASYLGDDGAYILGNNQTSLPGSTPINTWDFAKWSITGLRPTLDNLKPEGSENIIESTLPRLPVSTVNNYSYTSQDSYNTTNVVLNTALNSYTNTVSFDNSLNVLTEAQALSSGYDSSHIIHNASELINKITADMSGSFIMVGDIDMSSMGTFASSAISGVFQGKLQGNGYAIKNLSINTAGAAINNVGLFARIGATGEINNLGIENATIMASNSSSVGIITGNNQGKINYSYSTGSVTSSLDHIGGFIGYNTGTVTNSYSDANVYAVGSSNMKAGGFVGTVGGGSVSSSYATGAVSGYWRVGGFVGGVDGGSISNSYSTGNVTGHDSGVGGFVGYNVAGTITNSYALGDVSAASGLGGFAGMGSVAASNFYKNNMSTTSGSAVNGNVSPLPTGSWNTDIWDISGGVPVLKEIAKDNSITFAKNKYISGMTVSNATNPNQIFTEGKDFAIYTNDSGATWKMDVFSDEMKATEIKISYQGVDKGTVNQTNSGFDLYLGNSNSFNVRHSVLDLAGRLNFNITQNTPQSLLDAVGSLKDYINLKELQVKGSQSLATSALDEKKSKNSTMNNAVKSIIGIDEAKQRAKLVKEQLRFETTQNLLKQFYSMQISAAKILMKSSSNAYNNTGYTSNPVAYSALDGINSYNKSIINYYLQSLNSSNESE